MAVFRTDCPHCATNDVGFDVAWSYKLAPFKYASAAICGSCSLPITIVMAGLDQPPERLAGDISSQVHAEHIWPEITDLAAPRHTPDAVANRFIEGEDAYRRKRWNSAVAMYRSALDIATKALEGVPEKLSFYKRLIWLHENHQITQQMKDWADHVRVDGNDALHDPEEFGEQDARPLRLFTETFLRYLYELPGEVAEFRGETPATA